MRGIPLIAHTLKKFDRVPSCQEIIIATDDQSRLQKILAGFSWMKKITVVMGGPTRAESVVNMLEVVRRGTLVLVHDAARPCIRVDDIEQVARAALLRGAAVLATPARDTLKKVNDDGCIVATIDRAGMWHAQTPQAAYVDELLPAYKESLELGLNITDDIQVLEGSVTAAHVVPGHWSNLKITSPEDLPLAEAILAMEPDS